MLAGLEAEDLKLGCDPLGQVEVAELTGGDGVRHPVSHFSADRLGADHGEQV